jgi:cytoskeletal protein CcmA (bactofilin family)
MAATAHAPGVIGTDSDEFPSVAVVVGESGRFEGLLTFRGCARIDGEVIGEIICRGTLWLGETARVNAVIEVDELMVAGTIEGEVTARDRIELLPTARVNGILRAPRLALADGCVVEGRCETGVTKSAS